MFKRRPNAVYLDCDTCANCEANIFKPLDDYALKIYRDKDDSCASESEGGVRIIKYQSVNRQMLRGYLASLLWRMDLGRIMGITEMSNVNIGEYYREKIRNDLLDYKKAAFEYIDAFTVSLFGKENAVVRIPTKMRLFDGERSANGYMVQFPYLTMFISLDCREHPYVDRELPSWIEGSSLSVNERYDNKPYSIFQADHVDWLLTDLRKCVSSYNARAKGPQIKFS
jgi:hypothetical protein